VSRINSHYEIFHTAIFEYEYIDYFLIVADARGCGGAALVGAEGGGDLGTCLSLGCFDHRRKTLCKKSFNLQRWLEWFL
jgi:hypothetical protein